MCTLDPPAKALHYDLYLHAQGTGLHWGIPDHGIALTDEQITWTTGDAPQKARLTSIATIRLETGGTGESIVAMCQITFMDGTVITVLNCGSNGLPDGTQAPIYRDFVGDLHRRLVASKAQVEYIAGYTQGRYRFGIVIATIAGLFFLVLPLVLLLITGESKSLFIFIAGLFLVWPVFKLVQANAPHTYDPAHPPPELLL